MYLHHGYADLGYEPPSEDTQLILEVNFKEIKPGIFAPTNKATLDKFLNLQRQLNRAASAMKLGIRIAEDGRVGNESVAAARQISAFKLAVANANSLARYADQVAMGAKAKADALGVPAKVASPKPQEPPAILDPATNKLMPASASLFDSIKDLGTPAMIAIGAAAIGGIWYFTRKAK